MASRGWAASLQPAMGHLSRRGSLQWANWVGQLIGRSSFIRKMKFAVLWVYDLGFSDTGHKALCPVSRCGCVHRSVVGTPLGWKGKFEARLDDIGPPSKGWIGPGRVQRIADRGDVRVRSENGLSFQFTHPDISGFQHKNAPSWSGTLRLT